MILRGTTLYEDIELYIVAEYEPEARDTKDCPGNAEYFEWCEIYHKGEDISSLLSEEVVKSLLQAVLE